MLRQLSPLFALAFAFAACDRGTLDGPVEIASPAGAGAGAPNLFADADGRVYMSWLEPADSAVAAASTRKGEFALRFAVLDDAGEWSAPQTIVKASDLFVNWADFPSIIRTGAGTLVAHWLQRTGENTYAYAVRTAVSSDDGASWSVPVTPHSDVSPTEHGFVSLLPGTEGNTDVFWLDGRKYAAGSHGAASNEMTLRHAVLSTAGAVSGESELDARACDCCQTGAARTTSGAVVVYRDRSDAEIRDIYIVRQEGAEWSAPARVHADEWKIDACPVNGPSVSARGDELAVAWFTAARDTPKVNVSFSADGGRTFGEPVRVDAGGAEGRVDVELLTDGSALVTWIERTDAGAEIRLRTIARDGTAGPAVSAAAASAERAAGFPRAVIGGEYAVLAWTEPGKPARVRVARARLW